MKKNAIKVLDYLMTKPRVKALGFNKEELEGFAADLAENLDLAEDASEEDVQKAVETAVNQALPFLVIAQKNANRVIEANRKKVNEPGQEPKNEPGNEKNQTTEEVPAWAKQLNDTIKQLGDQVIALKGERVADSRRSILADMLKNTGTFGERILKNFDKMKFETDAEFEEFKADVEADLAKLNQERANAGLEKLGISGAVSARKNDQEDKVDVISDEQLEELADQL